MTIPSAEPFSAVGFFNGFPLVDTQWNTRKVDVSTYDRYEVLTLEQAVNIYFNLVGVDVSTRVTTDNGSLFLPGLNLEETDLAFQPKDRLLNYTISNTGSVKREFQTLDDNIIEVELNSNFYINKLYLGTPEDDDSNLEGYGFEFLADARATFNGKAGGIDSRHYISKGISSYVNESDDVGSITRNYRTVSVSGNPFVEVTATTLDDPPPDDGSASVGDFSFTFFGY